MAILRRGIVSMAALAASASCSLLVSTSDLVGRVATDAATASDAPTALDAPVGDRARGGDAFCARRSPKPVFCADFDQGSLELGWRLAQTSDGGTLALDPSTSVSPPSSLAASVPGGQATNFGVLHAVLHSPRTLGTASVSTHVAFDFRLDRADLDHSLQILAVSFDGPPGDYAVVLAVQIGSALLQQDVTPPSGPRRYVQDALLRAPDVGKWVRVDLDMSFADRTLVVLLDGTEVLRKPMDPDARPGNVWFRMGPIYFGSTVVDSAACHFDNVTLDLR